MHILPTIKPISPLSDTVHAQASNRTPSYNDSYANGAQRNAQASEKASKIGRQLSVASSTNNYAELHRQQAERALNGNSGLASPPSGHKESFFSHLRKRARRFSGRHQTPVSPASDDIEAQAGCGPWASNRSSMVIDQQPGPVPAKVDNYDSLDRTLQQNGDSLHPPVPPSHMVTPAGNLKRHHSLPHQQPRSIDNLIGAARASGPVSGRTRRSQATHGVHQYDAPAEEDELLDEALNSTHRAMKRMEGDGKPPLRQSASNIVLPSNVAMMNPYPTPSPSASGNQGMLFGDSHEAVTPTPLNMNKAPARDPQKWPTPPYEESEWASSAAASIWAAGNRF
jgi:meiosis induction protein kinase IME2/SME1